MSIGINFEKIWYRKKYRIRYWKKLVSEKGFGFGFVQILGFVTHCYYSPLFTVITIFHHYNCSERTGVLRMPFFQLFCLQNMFFYWHGQRQQKQFGQPQGAQTQSLFKFSWCSLVCWPSIYVDHDHVGKNLLKWRTSRPAGSVTWKLKGRFGPQHCLGNRW